MTCPICGRWYSPFLYYEFWTQVAIAALLQREEELEEKLDDMWARSEERDEHN